MFTFYLSTSIYRSLKISNIRSLSIARNGQINKIMTKYSSRNDHENVQILRAVAVHLRFRRQNRVWNSNENRFPECFFSWYFINEIYSVPQRRDFKSCFALIMALWSSLWKFCWQSHLALTIQRWLTLNKQNAFFIFK